MKQTKTTHRELYTFIIFICILFIVWIIEMTTEADHLYAWKSWWPYLRCCLYIFKTLHIPDQKQIYNTILFWDLTQNTRHKHTTQDYNNFPSYSQSSNETCSVLMLHTGVHAFIVGVVPLSSWSVWQVDTQSSIMEIICISVTLVPKY